VSAIALASCGGPVTTAPLAQATTPLTQPTPMTGPLSASPTSLSFSGTGQLQTTTVTDSGYTGALTVSGCSGIATTSGPTTGSLSVTSAAAGTCTLTITDTTGARSTVAITVSTLSLPVQ
jgi:hypothetical protein